MSLTEKQQEAWRLHQEGRSHKEICELLGIAPTTLRDRLRRARQNQAIDPAVQNAMSAFGLEQDPDTVWFKNKEFSVRYQKRPMSQESFISLVREAFSDLPVAPPIEAPTEVREHELALYPIFDLHHGLRAHKEVSGEEMTGPLSMSRIKGGMSRLMAETPNARRAIILNGGDFTHQTDDTNRTRRSGHVLDVSGRNVMTVLEAIEILDSLVQLALTKHETVEYFSVPGNHDPQNWETVQIAMMERYRDHPRVKIDENWTEFSVIEHGQVGIFVHHGDKRSPKDLAMFCSAEFPEVWGRTRYRILMTGHLHHWKLEEFPGIYWMQMPPATVRDSHAAGGYKSHSLLKSFVFDQQSETDSKTVKL